MNEFFVASNRSIKVGELLIHQLQMHNFDEWLGAGRVIKDFLDNHPSETAQKIFDEHPFESTQLIAYSLKCSSEQAVDFFKQESKFNIMLLDAAIKVNEAFFSEPKPKKQKSKRSRNTKEPKQPSWFETFQYLTKAGHRNDDIMQMSYGAFIGYLGAAQKQRSQSLLTNTNLMRAAQHAKDKAYAKLTDELKSNDD